MPPRTPSIRPMISWPPNSRNLGPSACRAGQTFWKAWIIRPAGLKFMKMEISPRMASPPNSLIFDQIPDHQVLIAPQLR
ncbi:hypothetical protein D3C77_459620 [compost metagenome]